MQTYKRVPGMQEVDAAKLFLNSLTADSQLQADLLHEFRGKLVEERCTVQQLTDSVIKTHKLQRQVSGINPFATGVKPKRSPINKPPEDLACSLYPSGTHTISECRTLKDKKGKESALASQRHELRHKSLRQANASKEVSELKGMLLQHVGMQRMTPAPSPQPGFNHPSSRPGNSCVKCSGGTHLQKDCPLKLNRPPLCGTCGKAHSSPCMLARSAPPTQRPAQSSHTSSFSFPVLPNVSVQDARADPVPPQFPPSQPSAHATCQNFAPTDFEADPE
jgi:hypothetical protein